MKCLQNNERPQAFVRKIQVFFLSFQSQYLKLSLKVKTLLRKFDEFFKFFIKTYECCNLQVMNE